VFASAGCGGCHTLAAARASGSVGPNLDTLRPGFDQVRLQVERGGGAMPAFRETLSAAQIRDVAAFVAERAGR
jgi:mono/diheme cytochrome c family protein